MKLYNDQTGELLGEVTEEDVQFLIDQLEEEGHEDQAYYLNPDMLQMLEDNGASPRLKELLGAVIRSRGEVDVRWSEE